MAFRFPLEILLRFQKSLERQQELLLQVANHELAQVAHQIEQTRSAIDGTFAQQERTLLSGAPAVEVQFLGEYRNTLRDHAKSLQQELQRRQSERRRLLESFQDSRRKREMTETLRERAFHAYRERQAREQQRNIDDLFMILRARSGRGLPL